MSEKRGHLVKMEYDFDTAGVLEVWVPKLNGWYRVTSRDFRSFDGKRRITKPIKPQGRGEIYNVPMETKEYFGPDSDKEPVLNWCNCVDVGFISCVDITPK